MPGTNLTNDSNLYNSNLEGISVCSHPNSKAMIVTKFCRWHNSCAVMVCSKLCCNQIPRNLIMANKIKIEFELWDKPSVKQTNKLAKMIIWEKDFCLYSYWSGGCWFIGLDGSIGLAYAKLRLGYTNSNKISSYLNSNTISIHLSISFKHQSCNTVSPTWYLYSWYNTLVTMASF